MSNGNLLRPGRASARHVFFLLFSLVIAGIGAAQGSSLTFGWTVGGQPRSVSLVETMREGVSYVSLEKLSSALGAGYNESNDRVQVDLVGQTVWIPIDGTDVFGSLDRMALTFPLVMINDEAMIAQNDVAPLFRTCFRVALTASAPTQQTSTAPLLEMPELEEDLAAIGQNPGLPVPERSGTGPSFRRIMIDPGHGGGDSGATGASGTAEKAVALSIARLLKTELEKTEGVTVWLTRSDDTESGPASRGNVAVEHNADCFVSVHVGASYAPSVEGFEIYYPVIARSDPGHTGASSPARTKRSEELAKTIAAAMTEATQMPSRGIRSAPLRSVPVSEAAAVVVEVGCITTPAEEALVNSPEFQGKVATAMAQGIQAEPTLESATP